MPTDREEPVRLQKYISDCGRMSRRAAESAMLEGRVLVNGMPAVPGDKVTPGTDTVTVDGEVISPADTGKTYIVLNKPVGFVCTMSDEKGRRTVADLVATAGKRLFPVGRLDMYSCGLLIMTDDGDFANRVTHPSRNIPKRYEALVLSRLSEDDVAGLSEPFELDGYMLRPFETELLGHPGFRGSDATLVGFTLHEGRNREIRRICSHHGLKIVSLKRVSVGPVELGDIQPGKYRSLSADEIAYLRGETPCSL